MRIFGHSSGERPFEYLHNGYISAGGETNAFPDGVRYRGMIPKGDVTKSNGSGNTTVEAVFDLLPDALPLTLAMMRDHNVSSTEVPDGTALQLLEWAKEHLPEWKTDGDPRLSFRDPLQRG